MAKVVPLAVNGHPIGERITAAAATNAGTFNPLVALSGTQGYDLVAGQAPAITLAKGQRDAREGHTLSATDAGTNHAVLPVELSAPPVSLRLGDMLTFGSQQANEQANEQAIEPLTVQVVGFYAQDVSATGAYYLGGAIFADTPLVLRISENQPYYLYALKLDPKEAPRDIGVLQAQAPTVQTFSIADLSRFLDRLTTNLFTLLTAVAALALVAAIMLIANTVALAMLERRREIGILKSLGFASRTVLGGVVIEMGTVGVLGGTLAMGLVALAVSGLDRFVFRAQFGASTATILGIIGATALLCILVAILVAWRPTRVRPLDVLRYE